MNALSCCHFAYSMVWQNNVINQLHSDKHKAVHFCSKCQHIFQVICTCLVGAGSEQDWEEHTARACWEMWWRWKLQWNSCWCPTSPRYKQSLHRNEWNIVRQVTVPKNTTDWVPIMHLDWSSTERKEVEFLGEIKIPQELRSCRCYYTLLQRPCSQRGVRSNEETSPVLSLVSELSDSHSTMLKTQVL